MNVTDRRPRVSPLGGPPVVKVRGRGFTPHALSRCGEMNVDLADVVDVIDAPERSYPSGYGHPPGRRIAAGNGLAVVFAEQGGTVVTVLWDGRTHR